MSNTHDGYKHWRERWGRPKEVTQPGPRVCLMCQRTFKSRHVIKERVCKDCKSTDAWKAPGMAEIEV